MSHLTDKVSYIRGLMEGMQLDTSTKEGKLLVQIVEVLGEMADEMEAVNAVQDELNEYVEDLDASISDLEQAVGLEDEDEEDELDDEDEDEEDFEFDEEDDSDETCSGNCEECSGCSGEGEDDDTDVYVECMCPNCNSTFYVLESELGENVFHVCPRCNERIHVEPDYDDEVPIAELADKDPEE